MSESPMKTRPLKAARLCASVLAAALAACGRAPAPTADADIVFEGGPIYTAADSSPKVEAVAVKGDRILAAGAKAAIDRLVGPHTEVIDLKGAALFPGFTDAHAHLFGVGMRELTLNLEGVGSVDELVDVIAANVHESKPGELIYGRGWIETGWPEGRFPSRDDLDPVSPDNPVVLVRADGHALVANSAAMKAAGVDEETPDPDGGRIEKDARGRPTGMFVDNAMSLLASLQATPSEKQKEEAYRTGAGVYAAHGWTGLHNMSVDPADVSIIDRLAASGDVPIRVYNALDKEGLDWLIENAPHTDSTGRVVTRAMKLYADGALGSRGAALTAPYSDMPDSSGLLLMHHDEAEQMLQRALRAGVQVATHAIGDRANHQMLDWYQEAFKAVPASQRKVAEPRWRIEHAQILLLGDIPRFAELGVIPSMQPSHAISDFFFAPARLGPDRLFGAYAWRSLIDAGSVIPGGSDAPVERGDPRIEFYAAVARKSLDGYSDALWHPEQKVTREEALKMFTLWPAYASFQEKDLGTIEPGKFADFTVFSKDIMTIPEADILKAAPVMTVVGGKIVYRGE
ncbi:MAG: amidohydrolase family protein [Alphaproteobacteria bacterium]|nr:amidohydrolase family protein [Alphaproteobacteria bacterium]